MSATELQFRTAAIGGFQKQDVLSYIESSNQSYAEKLEVIQRERDDLLQEKESLSRQAADAQAQLKRAEEERAGLREALAKAQKELQALQQRFDQQAQLLAETKASLERMEPAARAYEQVKDRTAGIELEAHCRAQEVQRQSEEKVQRARTEVEQWLHKVKAGYDLLRSDMDSAINRTAQELDKAYDTLTKLTDSFVTQGEHLDQLTQQCLSEFSPLAPEPLPLNDDQ